MFIYTLSSFLLYSTYSRAEVSILMFTGQMQPMVCLCKGGGRVFRNICKEHMDKTKVGWDQGRDLGMAGVGGGGRWQTTVLEQQCNLKIC